MASAKRRNIDDPSAGIQWIPDGPEIPVDAIDALEDGNLIIFCGAGVSVRANLPAFKKLTEQVYAKFPDRSEEIERLIQTKQYDSWIMHRK